MYIPFCICLAREVKLPAITIPGQGTIVGVEVSKSRIQKITAYYGIPYAKPPIGNLRFAPPDTEPLPEVTNNTGYLPACLQSEEDYKDSDKPFLQLISDFKFGNFSEDCLYLNVFVPVGSGPTPGFATIIWFHPGSFVVGTPAIWNPHTLVYRQRVIVVTVAWRLNIFGFLTTMDGVAPGNYGLMDQQAAMLWVKNNIELFGGNPNNICLMGYGAGATSVGLHMINPRSKGLFNKAIAMSGDYLSPSVVKKPEEDKELLDFLAKELSCERRPTSQLIQCLRRPDGNELVKSVAKYSWRPLLDASVSNFSFLPEFPINYFESGDYYKVPFLTGYTHMEKILQVNATVESRDELKDLLTKLIYNDIPQNNDTESSCVYNSDHLIDAVIFDMKPSTLSAVSQIPEWVTVPHLFDLIYVWGVPYWENTGFEWDIRDKRISDTIMSLWINFAKSSNPTENIIYPIKWDPFTKDDPGILIIDGTFNMSNSQKLNYKAFEFWNNYYPKVKDIATKCCESGDARSVIFLQSYCSFLFVSLLLMYNV
ncbi:hypothetical protein NQ314_020704 [Rhamnusium bicolor]|uniref:Carboxylesterase type B domain-containing protein n=1 Tax=Rhamnusium bicolor TaxID=1586634 RepID=A0AAV8WKH7_9CUCU|nr:hypothetical protein NQ314_020704 [Rhamnusium bicolor]